MRSSFTLTSHTSTSGQGASPCNTRTNSANERMARNFSGRARDASETAVLAITGMVPCTAATRGAMPPVGRNEPSRPSSAMNDRPCTDSTVRTSCATRTATAIARSSAAPPRLSPAPAKLMVMRRFGHSSPLDNMAARTRSRDSRHPSSGKPTTVNPGMPLPT